MIFARRQFLQLAAAAVVASATPQLASAQVYPTQPVRMIVPYAPGSAADTIARIIARKLSENIGKQFYIEDIGSASGNTGMGRAAQAAPDGYTVLVATSAYVVNPSPIPLNRSRSPSPLM